MRKVIELEIGGGIYGRGRWWGEKERTRIEATIKGNAEVGWQRRFA